MRDRMRLFSFLALAALGACATNAPRTGVAADPMAGLTYRHIDDPAGPWAIDVMEADLRACWRPVAVKGNAGAVGRTTTSAIVRALADTSKLPVGGGVNADFFLFAPPGVPTGAFIHDGRVITGPSNRAAIWFDRDGRATMGTLAAKLTLRLGREEIRVDSWNRRDGAVRIIDRGWGDSTNATPRMLELVVDGGRVARVDTLAAGVPIPARGIVIQMDSTAPRELRERLAAYSGSVSWSASLAIPTPQEAVGGNPVLVKDSAEVPGLDAVGGANFGPVRHPRTLVGVADGGRKLLFVVVDGRREGWSAGMTLRELAALMLRLGARDAINLDGGGSTAMVYRTADSLRLMNRPSDATGERPVGNALALVKRCR